MKHIYSFIQGWKDFVPAKIRKRRRPFCRAQFEDWKSVMDKARIWIKDQLPQNTRATNPQTVSCKLRGEINVNLHDILQAGPFSSQSTSWHFSVKSEHYEQSSQQIIEACHLTCQLGTLTKVRPLEFDNVKYVRGHNQYFFNPYQLKVLVNR